MIDMLHQSLLDFGDTGYVIWTLLKILAIAVPVIIAVAMFVYWERKIIGWMHARMGPNQIGPLGLLQAFADVFKLLFKEVIVPTKANKVLFYLAPLIALVPATRQRSIPGRG
jgi:NADH-quinone oxidoreductase subunit H